ncbi:MAG: hypothetical protein QOD33_743 [Pyrinomonadaceae bacterium]|jgi:hypothetical protein|nr:hypothetical protein [Pyrinomonadaceae bacterium]
MDASVVSEVVAVGFIVKRNGNTTLLERDATTTRLWLRLAEMWGATVEEAMHRTVEFSLLRDDVIIRRTWWETFKEFAAQLSLTSAKGR